MVIKLVEPSARRIVIERDNVEELRETSNQMKSKIDECEMYITKAARKANGVEDY